MTTHRTVLAPFWEKYSCLFQILSQYPLQLVYMALATRRSSKYTMGTSSFAPLIPEIQPTRHITGQDLSEGFQTCCSKIPLYCLFFPSLHCSLEGQYALLRL